MDGRGSSQRKFSPTNDVGGRDLTSFIPALRGYFARQTGSVDMADDLVQDVMVRVLARRSDEEIDNLEAYLFRTAASVLRDKARRNSVRKTELHKELTELDHPVEEFSPERVMLGREEIARLAAALRELPEKTRDIFLMKRFEGLSSADIAARVGMSVSGIEKQIAKAAAHAARRMMK